MSKSLISQKAYTFWVLDWNNSDAVFILNLEQRGLYRELIDIAMINDNKVKINLKLWARKFNSTPDKLQEILNVFIAEKLIEINENILIIPSCERRLLNIRRGRAGGLNSSNEKKESKPKGKPIGKPKGKPMGKHKDKDKDKDKDIYRAFNHLKLTTEEAKKITADGYTKKQLDEVLDAVENYSKNTNYKNLNLTARNWLKKRYGTPGVVEEEQGVTILYQGESKAYHYNFKGELKPGFKFVNTKRPTV